MYKNKSYIKKNIFAMELFSIMLIISFSNISAQYKEMNNDFTKIRVLKVQGVIAVVNYAKNPKNKIHEYFSAYVNRDTLFIKKNPQMKTQPYYCKVYLSDITEIIAESMATISINEGGFKNILITTYNSNFNISGINNVHVVLKGQSEGAILDAETIDIDSSHKGKIKVKSKKTVISGKLKDDSELIIKGNYINKGLYKKDKAEIYFSK